MSQLFALRRSILSALGLTSVALSAACQPDWSVDTGESDSAGSGGDEGGTDSGEPQGSDDYGECDPVVVDGLSTFEELMEQSDGQPVITPQLYCLDEFSTADDCLACIDDCQWEIASEFEDQYSHSDWGYYLSIECGPMWLDERCCFQSEIGSWTEGRPFRIDGHERRATVEVGDDWSASCRPDPVSRRLALRLAKHWTEQGLAEHASVASFGRFGLQLMHLGAPPELLVESARAMADEIDHARRCFGLASAYGGSSVAPGSLDTSDSHTASVTARSLLVETFTDGCINESMAAAEARLLAAQVIDPELRKVLEVIAEDETRHAALAWKTIRWLLEQNPELRAELASLWTSVETDWENRLTRLAADTARPDLNVYGVLDGPGRARLGASVLAQVIEPCLRALLESSADDVVAVEHGALGA